MMATARYSTLIPIQGTPVFIPVSSLPSVFPWTPSCAGESGLFGLAAPWLWGAGNTSARVCFGAELQR